MNIYLLTTVLLTLGGIVSVGMFLAYMEIFGETEIKAEKKYKAYAAFPFLFCLFWSIIIICFTIC